MKQTSDVPNPLKFEMCNAFQETSKLSLVNRPETNVLKVSFSHADMNIQSHKVTNIDLYFTFSIFDISSISYTGEAKKILLQIIECVKPLVFLTDEDKNLSKSYCTALLLEK